MPNLKEQDIIFIGLRVCLPHYLGPLLGFPRQPLGLVRSVGVALAQEPARAQVGKQVSVLARAGRRYWRRDWACNFGHCYRTIIGYITGTLHIYSAR